MIYARWCRHCTPMLSSLGALLLAGNSFQLERMYAVTAAIACLTKPNKKIGVNTLLGYASYNFFLYIEMYTTNKCNSLHYHNVNVHKKTHYDSYCSVKSLPKKKKKRILILTPTGTRNSLFSETCSCQFSVPTRSKKND